MTHSYLPNEVKKNKTTASSPASLKLTFYNNKWPNKMSNKSSYLSGLLTTTTSSSLTTSNMQASYPDQHDILMIDDDSLYLNLPFAPSLRSCFVVGSGGLTDRSSSITGHVLKKSISCMENLMQADSEDENSFYCQEETPRNILEHLNIVSQPKKHTCHKVRAALLGDEATGKSALVSQYIKNEFPQYHDCTIQDTYSKIIRKTDEHVFELFITDTAGSDQYKILNDQIIKDHLVFIFVFDVTNMSSFENLKTLIMEVQDKKLMYSNLENFPIIIVGNKTDLKQSRVVTKKQVKNLIWNELKLKINLSTYVEVSSKERYHVDKVFKKALQLVDHWNCLYNLESPCGGHNATPSTTNTPRTISSSTSSLLTDDDSSISGPSLFYIKSSQADSDTDSDISCSLSDISESTLEEVSIPKKKTRFGIGKTTKKPKRKFDTISSHSATELSMSVGSITSSKLGLKKVASFSSSLFRLALGNSTSNK